MPAPHASLPVSPKESPRDRAGGRMFVGPPESTPITRIDGMDVKPLTPVEEPALNRKRRSLLQDYTSDDSGSESRKSSRSQSWASSETPTHDESPTNRRPRSPSPPWGCLETPQSGKPQGTETPALLMTCPFTDPRQGGVLQDCPRQYDVRAGFSAHVTPMGHRFLPPHGEHMSTLGARPPTIHQAPRAVHVWAPTSVDAGRLELEQGAIYCLANRLRIQ